MKVTVKRVAPIMYKNPRLQAEFEETFYRNQCIESLIQENKDLRVSEGHLRDDLACAEARIEKLTAELAQVKKDASQAALATGEILIKADHKAQEQEALIAELNEQIAASETDAAFWKKAAAENAELAGQNIAQVAAWERSTNELKHEVTWWKVKAKEATAELVKCDVGHYQREIDEWKATADKLSEQLRELQAVFADLQLEHQELSEDYDALVKTKCEYAEYIDTLRQEIKRLRNQMSLPEFMRQFIEMTRETVQNEFPDSGNS